MKPRALLLALLVSGSCAAAGPVDVNSASLEDLQRVRGIGPAIAARILDARAHGPFRDADDLQDRVKGLGAKTVGRMVSAGLAIPAFRLDARARPDIEVIVGRPVAQSVPAPAASRSCPVGKRVSDPPAMSTRRMRRRVPRPA